MVKSLNSLIFSDTGKIWFFHWTSITTEKKIWIKIKEANFYDPMTGNKNRFLKRALNSKSFPESLQAIKRNIIFAQSVLDSPRSDVKIS